MTTLKDITDPTTRALVRQQIKDLRKSRKELGITLRELADELNVNVSKVVRFEQFKCYDLTFYFNYIDLIKKNDTDNK